MAFTERQCSAMDNARDEQKERALAKSATQRQAIPVVAQRSIDLFALWGAFLRAPFGTVVLHESLAPGAAKTLSAWAASRGLAVIENVMVTPERTYVNRDVHITPGQYIAVLNFRAATDEEIAAKVAMEARYAALSTTTTDTRESE